MSKIHRRLTRQLQLKDPTLFKQGVCYVNGEWVKSKSGKTFEVHGNCSPPVSGLFLLIQYAHSPA
jgi:hypothetical protein